MSCPCDDTVSELRLDIAAGLDDLPRQLWTFTEARTAMLDRAWTQPALAGWRARASDDYGVMWLELVAYVSELLSIYDKAIADESYVRTAKRRPSLRRLLELLGYVPRPAVASSVELALLAATGKPVSLPVGTGFRSGAFAGQPPQVFELTAPATIHPALNKWAIATPSATALTGSITTLLLDPATARVVVGDAVLLELSSADADAHARTVTAVDRLVDDTGRRVVRVTLDAAVAAGAGKPVSGVRLRKATRVASLKSPSGYGADPASFRITGSSTTFDLDGIYREARQGERCLVHYGADLRWCSIATRSEVALTVEPSRIVAAITIDVPGTPEVVIPQQTIPAATSLHTRVVTHDDLDAPGRRWHVTAVPWLTAVIALDSIQLGLGLVSCGRVLGPSVTSIAATDALAVPSARAPIGSTAATTRLILRDEETRGVAVGGSVNFATRQLALTAGTSWTPGLAPVVHAYGNVVTAVRGETVSGEVLGSGDATQIAQRWKLAKKPLTYQAVAGAASDAGVVSSLVVWVDGLQWTEVPSFFGSGPDAQVFIVRQDDAGDSWVTFGDGVRGARLPSGGGNVVVAYRFGAGAASPPAGSIAQLARPVPGLASVLGPIAASGGADAESAESLRTLAPRSALLLGRAISIEDMEVAARLTPGVTTARADWAWDGVRQRPVVKVWVVGAPALAATVAARLHALSDPDVPIEVAPATAVVAALAIDLELDPRRVATTVLADVQAALFGADGWLTPAVLGIATPLLRSPLLAALLTIPGVTGVRGLSWNGAPLLAYGVEPGPGAYFDLAATAAVTGS